MSTTRHQLSDDPDIEIVDGVCPHDCPDTCAWQVAVRRSTGEAVDLWGHPDHPVTTGSLCSKVDRYLERTYHTDRLRHPLRRIGPKGSGRFEPISWAAAIELARDGLRAAIARHGPETVLPYSYAGTMGLLQGEGMAQPFFHRLGASGLARSICAEAGAIGYRYTIGASYGMDPLDLRHSRLILLWGSNALTSNVHLWKVIQSARKRGARLVVIDPLRTRTAAHADSWIGVRPGTDAALALGMMHVILRANLHDRAYLENACVGFAPLASSLEAWTPERVEAVTGVPEDAIVALATAYATTRPAAIRINYGMQRHAGGGMATRTIACLPAFVGAWRDAGGGIVLSTSGVFSLALDGLHRPDLRSRPSRTINMNRLGDALSVDPRRLARAHYHPRPNDPLVSPANAGPPVTALVVYNSNPAVVAPDQGAVLEGLARTDLFTIVLEQFRTDTADFADLILPATTQLEHWDLLKPYGHFYLALNRPAIAPIGESLPNSEIFRRLARAMDFDDACFAHDDERLLADLLHAQHHPNLATISWPQLRRDGFARVAVPSPFLPFAEGKFPTPSGKCELFSETMVRDGYPGLPSYTAPAGLVDEAASSGDWLRCVTPPAHSFLNSTFVNVEVLRRREREPSVLVSPTDAARRGLSDGARVDVSSAQGSIRLRLVVDDGVPAGTAAIPSTWWRRYCHEGRSVNTLTSAAEADMGAGALFHDLKVQIRAVLT